MRPRILVTCSFNDHEAATRLLVAYCDAIVNAGGLPLVAPVFTDPQIVEEALASSAGVLLIGGPDYHPDAYGGHPQPIEQLMHRRRHEADLLLMRMVLRRRLPVLGICGGLQLLVLGHAGALVQDIPSEWPAAIEHNAEDPYQHLITITPGSRLHAVLGVTSLNVNSHHHQAARPDRCAGLRVSATAPDGVVEALENPDHPFCLGVQWHPERQPDAPASQALFTGLVTASR